MGMSIAKQIVENDGAEKALEEALQQIESNRAVNYVNGDNEIQNAVIAEALNKIAGKAIAVFVTKKPNPAQVLQVKTEDLGGNISKKIKSKLIEFGIAA